eukprot:TRINITY_DN10903_c0_g1_i1.p1 TRINITY_DN10903_c0_g1~~TRINITY_DN10903_c0_g1_i1.p1  ORF type:complete len:296 (-),score=63.84 TRINITY_DN10903_c0_g1_i1:239-1126(-)
MAISLKQAKNIYSDDKLADTYRSVRTIYPEEYYETIVNYYKKHHDDQPPSTVVDIATGHGQVAFPLSARLPSTKLFGIDKNAVSDAVLRKVEDEGLANRLQFVEGAAETFMDALEEKLKDTDPSFTSCHKSIDLLTVAQAFHWFDEDIFLKQVKSGLKTGGVFCISAYGPKMTFLDHDEAGTMLHSYWTSLKSYAKWADWFESHYKGFETRLEELSFGSIERHHLKIVRSFTFSQIESFIKSWAILNLYKAANPNSPDPSIEAVGKLRAMLSPTSEEQLYTISWDLTLITSRLIN